MNRRRPLILAAAGGLAAAGLLLPAGPTQAAAPYRLAVTFDGTTAASWLHVQGTGTAPTASVVSNGTGAVTRTTWTTATIPSYVASIPGVVATDQHVGVFPAYAASGNNFAAVKVTPGAFGSNDVLAPGTKDFQFGADIKFNSPLPPNGGRVDDNGNNVIQRGLFGGDQYKIQVDEKNGVFTPTCVLTDKEANGGVGVTTEAKSTVSVLASSWYRMLCSRTTVGGVDSVTFSVENLTAGTSPVTVIQAGTVLTNLNYAAASASSPIPLSVGSKIANNGAIVVSKSDQFNGRIDNGYLNIS